VVTGWAPAALRGPLTRRAHAKFFVFVVVVVIIIVLVVVIIVFVVIVVVIVVIVIVIILVEPADGGRIHADEFELSMTVGALDDVPYGMAAVDVDFSIAVQAHDGIHG
jgi:hypothetical protein